MPVPIIAIPTAYILFEIYYVDLLDKMTIILYINIF